MFFGAVVNAQETKIGYTSPDYILSLMPETKQIESEFKAYESQLQKQLESKMKDFQQKGQEFQQNAANMTDLVRADKEEELVNLQASIEKFQREAQNSISQKRNELLQPAYRKIQEAINEVAEENNYTHIISSDVGGASILLYAKQAYDVSDLVLKKLGINPPQE